MKVTVVGTGYVGLVSGTCLAEVGNDVLCLDVDPEKIRILNEGGIPIFEPGLLDMVKRNVAAGRLRFTTDVEQAVAHGTIQFIAVGTPPDEDGSADLQYVLAAARNIGRHMGDYKVVVDKSTVPVGTADRVRELVAAARGEDSDARFVAVLAAMTAPKPAPLTPRILHGEDGDILGQARKTKGKTVIELSGEGRAFADWLVDHMTELHRDWRSSDQ